jgi:hypothetical protein
MPMNSQPMRQQQYPFPGHFAIPQQQFMPNWINQSQHLQGRVQDQRSNTQVIGSRLQPQGTQSQKSLDLQQA